MPAGTLVRVPPDVVHGFRNASDAELRFLNFHAPGHGVHAYMRDLRDGRQAAYDQWDPPEDGGRPISEVEFGERTDVPAIKVFPAETEPGALGVAHGRPPHRDLRARGRAARIGDARAPEGSWVHVPPGEPHTLTALGEAPARYLVVHTPA